MSWLMQVSRCSALLVSCPVVADLPRDRAVATHLNDQIRQHEHDLRVLALQQRFERLAAPLLVPGRRLLKEATVRVYLQDIQGDQRCIFLFTDMLLLARPRERITSPTLLKETATPLVEDLSISLADLTVAAGRERAFDSCAGFDMFAADRAFSITTGVCPLS